MNNENDIKIIMSHRYDLGSDNFTTLDYRISKGSPFSLLESVSYLHELQMDRNHPFMKACADTIFLTWNEKGQFKTNPGSYYPCYTIHAANVLALLGFIDDYRLQTTLDYLMHIQEDDGGWKCNKYSYGKGEETNHSNPFPTLVALNIFRHTKHCNDNPLLNKAVEFLLKHWETRKPIGPCHYGIGSLFMQIEYPFRTYNLFNYVYTLSFYDKARGDKRFIEAFNFLKNKIVDQMIVVERVPPKLSKLDFCSIGKTSELATKRYHEICDNLLLNE